MTSSILIVGSRGNKAVRNSIREYVGEKDFFFKLSHRLCDGVGMIFAEDLNLKALGRSALRKACLDAAWGSFLNILSHVCWKRGVYFAKVDANGTSQICPHCGTNCGKKTLAQRVHPKRELWLYD